MIRSTRWLSAVGSIVMLGAMLALAGCSGNVKSTQASDALASFKPDTTVKTYKGGQFELDGAVISPLDLGSHFAYLKDQGKLPKTVLLERSDESKIRKRHLQYMARMALDYGFAVYYDHKGELRRINPVAKDARTLDDGTSKMTGHNPLEGKRASDSAMPTTQDPNQRQRQY